MIKLESAVEEAQKATAKIEVYFQPSGVLPINFYLIALKVGKISKRHFDTLIVFNGRHISSVYLAR